MITEPINAHNVATEPMINPFPIRHVVSTPKITADPKKILPSPPKKSSVKLSVSLKFGFDERP